MGVVSRVTLPIVSLGLHPSVLSGLSSFVWDLARECAHWLLDEGHCTHSFAAQCVPSWGWPPGAPWLSWEGMVALREGALSPQPAARRLGPSMEWLPVYTSRPVVPHVL